MTGVFVVTAAKSRNNKCFVLTDVSSRGDIRFVL